jgi:hypothetical protein
MSSRAGFYLSMQVLSRRVFISEGEDLSFHELTSFLILFVL